MKNTLIRGWRKPSPESPLQSGDKQVKLQPLGPTAKKGRCLKLVTRTEGYEKVGLGQRRRTEWAVAGVRSATRSLSGFAAKLKAAVDSPSSAAAMNAPSRKLWNVHGHYYCV